MRQSAQDAAASPLKTRNRRPAAAVVRGFVRSAQDAAAYLLKTRNRRPAAAVVRGFVKGLLVIGLFAGALATAQPGLAPPEIGYLRDNAGNMRPLHGISGTFWLGDVAAVGVDGVASSGRASMVLTRQGLRVLDASGHPVGRTWPAAGPVLFAFTSAGAPALVWLSSSQELLRWNGLQFERLSIDPGVLSGTAVSLAAPDLGRAAFLVQRGEQLWRVDLSLLDGSVLASENIPAAAAPVILLDDGTIVYARVSQDIVIRNPQGMERSVPFSGSPAALTLLGQDWILAESGSPQIHSALRLGTGALFELPEPAGMRLR